jgi:hypothetical protein
MSASQDQLAAAFRSELVRHFSSTTTTVSVRGSGASCQYIVTRGDSQCRISWHTLADSQYSVTFERGASRIAMALTPSRDATVAAVEDWLDGQERSVLYDQYPFVDQWKRGLTRLHNDVTACVPEIASDVECRIEEGYGSWNDLRYQAGDRSCEVSYCVGNEFPNATFFRDGRELFEHRVTDNHRFAAILSRWLCSHAPPSALRREFPALINGRLADYYEQGRPIEGEFIQSWDQVEAFYDDPENRAGPQVKPLISAMRARGYDRTLRAGTSLWSLMLSRSRRHGLRPDQPYVSFWFRRDGMDVSERLGDENANRTVSYSEIRFMPEFDELLSRLQAVPID